MECRSQARDRCLDFQPSVEPHQLWGQKGIRFADDDPVLEQPTYGGRPVAMPRQRFTPEPKLELLDYHPINVYRQMSLL
ncbi:hypothetical protein H6F61_11465 [Cyanobacteria bacterium FACHB-472]|nr:hypothetical protein [Cyanobacteria bacterium FACHB-472]